MSRSKLSLAMVMAEKSLRNLIIRICFGNSGRKGRMTMIGLLN